MKKILFASVFALMGTFAMANQTGLEVKTEFYGGWCEITVYNSNGGIEGYTVVWTVSESACERKAQEYLKEVEARLD